MVNLAIIGDMHHCFTEFDVGYFNESAYDLLLFTGDLPYHGRQNERRVVELLASLNKPALLIPGNHDCASHTQFMAEASGQTWLVNAGSHQQQELANDLRAGLGPVTLCGYSTHEFCFADLSFTVIAARPLSFGGKRISYQNYLRSSYAVDSLESSAECLKQLVDAAESSTLLFLGHNGPSGLGSNKEDIWGRDFKKEGGDYGDPDFEAAIIYAKAKGRQVPIVIAGHMHHELRFGGQRCWMVERAGTTYINAARVPRITGSMGQTIHHHIQITLEDSRVTAGERLVPAH